MKPIAPYQVLSKAQADRLRDCATTLSKRVVLELGLRCGLRPGEIVRLRWEPAYEIAARGEAVGWVDNDTGHLEVYSKGRHTVNGMRKRTPRHVPIPSDITGILEAHRGFQEARRCPLLHVLEAPNGRAYAYETIHRWVKKMAEEAGLDPRFSPHDLRHTFATELLRVSGNDIKMVQQALGHKNLQTTSMYLHVQPDRIREAIERMGR